MMSFHPLVREWFEGRFEGPSPPQRNGWPVIQEGHNVLIAAPTGSGKTLSAFLCAIDELVRLGLKGELRSETRILYVSPLKALANDIGANLLEPLEEIQALACEHGLDLPRIRVSVRTGDTPQSQRRKTLERPPHIFVTTPESLFILMTTPRGRNLLAAAQSVIVDEIHSLARDKRGTHLSLTLEFLEELAGRPLQRIGLSATQKPIDRIAHFLSGGRPTTVIDTGQSREMDLRVDVPPIELGAVATHEIWEEIYDRLARLIDSHRTTLVFVNTRRLAERLSQQLSERLGPENVAAHHGSLAWEIRLQAEQKLKKGHLRVVVATASLELGIDIGSVDLVCQIGSTRSIALAMQRVGRSGHQLGGRPKGVLFPTTRDDLVECSALVRSIRRGELDSIRVPVGARDILAQQLVAAASMQEWEEGHLLQIVRRASPYRELSEVDFKAILSMLSEGISTRKGRARALLHRDRINRRVKGRRGAQLLAITSGGAIPENANYLVKVDPDEAIIGNLDEDFAVESNRGDIFLLGNTSWRIQRVEAGVVRVQDAGGMPPTIPFWRGEAPGRTDELSDCISELRELVGARPAAQALQHLVGECGCSRSAAEQVVAYLKSGSAGLNATPTKRRIVAERFFDEGGGMQLVLHAPFGSRINKAWGLALRKRFCRSFNFELQAAATDNGIVISLSDQHSFPLDSVFSFLSSRSAREVLIQSLLAVPLFGTRWRWTATRALQVSRFSGGRKVPPPLQRLRADDLLAAVFPEQAACLEHIHGDIELPDHPLVAETVNDCLTDAMDAEGLERVLAAIESGEIECLAIDTREPSPLSHEILNANPYAFLDEAPLEERRTRAVMARRSLLPEQAGDLAGLDQDAIETVQEQAWPLMRDLDEVHDALLTLALVSREQLSEVWELVQELLADRRALLVELPDGEEMVAATERLGLILSAHPDLPAPAIRDDPGVQEAQWSRDKDLDHTAAARELVRYLMECSGPRTEAALGDALKLSGKEVHQALLALEAQGQVLRGHFTPGNEQLEWCDRTLLARIHRLTLGRLRREIEPVTAADFMRFLFKWQRVAAGTGLHGRAGVDAVLEQLQGFEAPASGWETSLLPFRVPDYSPEFLDGLCLSGHFTWGRLCCPGTVRSPGRRSTSSRPSKIAPVAFLRRKHLQRFLCLFDRGSREPGDGVPLDPRLTHPAREVAEQLRNWGALFFNDLVSLTGRLPVEVESGLWELVAAGVVTADGFATLRALIDPLQRRGGNRFPARKRLRQKNLSSGRWTLIRPPRPVQDKGDSDEGRSGADLEWFAWVLVRRWGVVFRDILKRESFAPAWRDLVRVFRRLEAQGRIRAGRFVSGFAGEQFAAPEAVDALRAVRRASLQGEVVRVSAADPLNLVGIVTPGDRVRPHPRTLLYYKDGLQVDAGHFSKLKS